MTTILLIIAAGLLILNLILFFDVRAHDRRLGELGNSAARADQNIDTRITGLNLRLAGVEERVDNTTDYCTTNELYNDDVGETLESNARDIEALRAEVFSGSALIDSMAANNSETRKLVLGLRERVESVEEVCATRKMVEGLREKVETLQARAESKTEDDNHAESRLDELSDGLALVREHASGTSFSISELYDKVNKLQRDGPDLREKLDDVEESMTLLAHEATVDRDRAFTMSNKLDAISRAQAPTSNREIEDSINDVAGKLDKTDFLVFQIAQRLQGLNELENKVDRLSKAFNGGGLTNAQKRQIDELKAQIEKVNRRVGHCEDINAKRQQHNSQQRDKCHQRIISLENKLTAVKGQPELTLHESRPDGVATTIYKTDGTVITTYPNGTVVTSRPCKDDRADDRVYSVWDDRPEAPKGKTSRPFIDVVPTNQNLGYIQNHHIVQDATGTQIPPRIARTTNGKLAIRIYTDGAAQ